MQILSPYRYLTQHTYSRFVGTPTGDRPYANVYWDYAGTRIGWAVTHTLTINYWHTTKEAMDDLDKILIDEGCMLCDTEEQFKAYRLLI